MKVDKVRFLEPGNLPYRRAFRNLYTYEKYIRNPSTGLITLATIAKKEVDDTLMYSESISKIRWKDVLLSLIHICALSLRSGERFYQWAEPDC